MCGIFGTINYKVSENYHDIVHGLFHRGPDEQNFTAVDNVELYHTRLAIQDLSVLGQQPMSYDGLFIVFNGEIYNHLELRKKYNLTADSHSDTKTILMLYRLLGIKMLDEFDGMFAFCLYDSKSKQMYLARDRAGKKPLYYYRENEKLVFSSELNILYKITRPDINRSVVASYLYGGGIFRSNTAYKNVKELESGTYLRINTVENEITDHRWWNIKDYYLQNSSLGYEESIDQLNSHLTTAVRRRMESSDLDVGTFLSGGIDSGLVTAIAAQNTSRLKTFTVRINGAYDESDLAQKVAEKYATDHTVVTISFSDLKNDIEKILLNYGEPFCDSSAIPSYYVSKAAKEYITVVLNGDGADELFGGYRRYVPFRHFNFFNSNKLVQSAAKILSSLLPIANEKKSRYNYIYRLLKLASYNDPVQIYRSATSDLCVGFEDQFLQQTGAPDFEQFLYSVKQLPISSLKKVLLLDFETILFGSLLPKMDIASMAHSIEGRSPFLAHEILEFAPRLNDDFKIHKTQTKRILRDLANNYLPPELINQPKRGFEIPLKSWVNGTLKEIIHDYLLSSNVFYAEFIKKSFIQDLIQKRVKISDERRAKILYCVFTLEVWHKNLKQVKNPGYAAAI